jgi:PBP1b-binding outer membrane lipoprotein LpoB
MKTKSITLLFIAPLLLSGCVATQYQKSVSVTKDASGNIVSSVETESVIQPNQQGWPVKFEHLKGVQPGTPK